MITRNDNESSGAPASIKNDPARLAPCNPGGEAARLAALHRYEVLDTSPEEVFDRITRLVKAMLEMPMAAIALIDRDRLWLKSKQGLKISEAPRGLSFCTQTIEGTASLIVNDAHADPRFAASPLVAGEPHIRFYVGVPLRSRDGYNVGTLCAMDSEPRDLNPQQVTMLEDLARLIVDEFELRGRACPDALTGAMSRRAFKEQADREIARAGRYGSPLSCALIDVDHFKSINERYGHGVGDQVLKQVASICGRVLRASDCIGRIGGEELALLLTETGRATALDVAERLRRTIAATAFDAGGGRTIKLTVSIGVAQYSEATRTFDALLSYADLAMYDAKSNGRNRVAGYTGNEVTLLRRSDERKDGERSDGILALAS